MKLNTNSDFLTEITCSQWFAEELSEIIKTLRSQREILAYNNDYDDEVILISDLKSVIGEYAYRIEEKERKEKA